MDTAIVLMLVHRKNTTAPFFVNRNSHDCFTFCACPNIAVSTSFTAISYLFRFAYSSAVILIPNAESVVFIFESALKVERLYKDQYR